MLTKKCFAVVTTVLLCFVCLNKFMFHDDSFTAGSFWGNNPVDLSTRALGAQMLEKQGDINRLQYVQNYQDLRYVNSNIKVLSTDDFNYEGLLEQTNYSAAAIEEAYFSLITHLDVTCPNWYRAGRKGDGGWNVCDEEPFKPKAPCLVYSFGIAFDFSFDDAMAKTYDCSVRSFDPSTPNHKPLRPSGVQFYPIGLDEQNGKKRSWEMKTLKTLMEDFKESNRTLDVLKMDIEHSEWGAFRTILKDNTLAQVKQLVFETHVRNKQKGAEEMIIVYREYINVIREIRNQGFAMWDTHVNPACMFNSTFSAETYSRCNELSFLNMNYLKDSKHTPS